MVLPEQGPQSPEMIRMTAGTYGLITDLHLGSPDCDIGSFKQFIQEANGRGVRMLLSAGDIFDLHALTRGTATVDNYLTQAGRVRNLLEGANIKLLSVVGNHDMNFKSEFPEEYEQVREVLGPSVHFFQEHSVVVHAGNTRILLDHYASDTHTDEYDLTVGGHSHQAISRKRFVNPGTFKRRSGIEPQIGAAFYDTESRTVEQWGDYSHGEKTILTELMNLGFRPETSMLGEGHYAEPIVKSVLESIRQKDPEASVWVTGSSARNAMVDSIGVMNNRYRLHTDEHDNPVRITSDVAPDVQLNGKISDIDIEVISDLLNPDDLTSALNWARTIPEVGNKPLKIEGCCYRRSEIDPYLSQGADPSIHNFMLYRFLLAPKGTVDLKSQAEVSRYARRALTLMEAQTNGEVAHHPAVKTALGYAQFKEIKRSLKRGELSDIDVPPDSPLFTYLQVQTANTPAQGKPPYATADAGSFKVVVPPMSADTTRLAVSRDAEQTDVVATVPLTAYTDEIHMGQLMSTFVGSILARVAGKDHEPYMFQVTGPYWDRQNMRTSEVIERVVHNIDRVREQLCKYGVEGNPIRDDDPQNINMFVMLYNRWVSLGLIRQTDNGPALEIGRAVTLFGHDALFTGQKNRKLSEAASLYMQEEKLLPLYSSSRDTAHTLYVDGTPIYPTFPILTMPYTRYGSISGLLAVSGENVATQFGLGHAITSKSLTGNPIEYSNTALLTDHEGQRLSRHRGTIQTNTQLLQQTAEMGKRFRKGAYPIEEDTHFAVMWGLVSHISGKDQRQMFDHTQFENGFRILERLRNIYAVAQAPESEDVPEQFVEQVRSLNFTVAMRDFQHQVHTLNKAIANGREIDQNAISRPVAD